MPVSFYRESNPRVCRLDYQQAEIKITSRDSKDPVNPVHPPLSAGQAIQKMTHPAVSVIIVTWNSEEYVQGCLGSIGDEHETVLVDNNSKDRTVEIVSQQFPLVHVIRNPRNMGLSRAINQGARLATGEYLLLLNPDVILMKSTIPKLYDLMESRKDVGACGPRFLWPNGRVQRSCRELPTFKNLFLEFSGLGRLLKCSSWKMWYFDHRESREVEQPMGSCLMVRRELFDRIGGMNEQYPIFMNDVELCYKMKEAGHKLYFVADADIVHHLGGSTRKARRRMILEEHRSMYRYLKTRFGNRFLVALYGLLLLTSTFYRTLFSLVARKR